MAPNFAAPEYGPYVSLCRRLHTAPPSRRVLPVRDIGPGDWWVGDEGPPAAVTERMRNDHDVIWLPQLGDWLGMLEAARCRIFRIRQMGDGWRVAWDEPNGYAVTAPTPEEAAGRLWMAATLLSWTART